MKTIFLGNKKETPKLPKSKSNKRTKNSTKTPEPSTSFVGQIHDVFSLPATKN